LLGIFLKINLNTHAITRLKP